jgi:hypothetical protein
VHETLLRREVRTDGVARAPRRGELPGGERGARAGDARLPLAVAAVVALVVVVGAVMTLALPERAFDSYLGAPHPPFLWLWRPRVDPLAFAAVPVFVLAVWQAPRLRWARVTPPVFAGAIFVLALVLRLALSAAREGSAGWYAAFVRGFNADNEYLPSLPTLDLGLGTFLDRFDVLAPTLSLHPSAHPPGMLVTLHLLGIDGVTGMTWLVILVGTLAVPLTYALGRQLLDESRARCAGLLMAFSPSALIYGVSSADALFATLGLAAAVALVARRRLVSRLLGPLLLALAAGFSYPLLAVGAWAALVRWRLSGPIAAARLAAAATAGVVVVYAGLYGATGFDPLASLAAAADAYRSSVATVRPYAYWVLGSPSAFLVALGLPISWYATRAVADRRAVALALAAIVVVSALLGFTKAETERIWLFMVPFACLAAAAVLPARRLAQVLGALALQALAIELLLETIW